MHPAKNSNKSSSSSCGYLKKPNNSNKYTDSTSNSSSNKTTKSAKSFSVYDGATTAHPSSFAARARSGGSLGTPPPQHHHHLSAGHHESNMNPKATTTTAAAAANESDSLKFLFEEEFSIYTNGYDSCYESPMKPVAPRQQQISNDRSETAAVSTTGTHTQSRVCKKAFETKKGSSGNKRTTLIEVEEACLHPYCDTTQSSSSSQQQQQQQQQHQHSDKMWPSYYLEENFLLRNNKNNIEDIWQYEDHQNGGFNIVNENDDDWGHVSLIKSLEEIWATTANNNNNIDDWVQPMQLPVVVDNIPSIVGRVYDVSRIQAGSRYLQNQLLKDPTFVDVMVPETLENIAELMVHPYANYLCQQMFNVCSREHLVAVIKAMGKDAVTISTDRRGTHCIQSLISMLTLSSDKMLLMFYLKDDLIELSTHPHGTHVVQQIISTCSASPAIDVALDLIAENLERLSSDPNGLCVVKRAFSACRNIPSYRQRLSAKLCEHCAVLISSPYGNYAVQHALTEFGEETCIPLIHRIKGHIDKLSIQKFASNVVEKAFEIAPQELAFEMVEKLIENTSVLTTSAYACFVVPKALSRATSAQATALLVGLTKATSQLSVKRLKHRWEKVLNQYYHSNTKNL